MKVMIIDDERDICVYLMAVLEDNGYATCMLDENEDVAESIYVNKPDLIVLDIMMPRRSGVSIYREIRADARFRDIPVVIMSGMSEAGASLEKEFGRLVGDDGVEGPDGFIEKPVHPPEFVDLVATILKERGRHD